MGPGASLLTRMKHAFLLRVAAVVFVVAGTETAAPSRQAAQSIAFTRLDIRLEGLELGTAVIRDSLTWRTLWRYFGREYRSEWDSPLPDSIATPPPVDFARNVIVAVNGTVGGCDDGAITRIEADGTRLRVVLGVAEPQTETMCFRYPEVGPILEAVVVPGRWRRVSFVGARPDYAVPSPANWWATPSVKAALDTGRSALKDVSWRVLPRDSTLSLKDLRRLAQGASEGVGPGLGLLGNPRVRGTSELLTVLGRGAHASLLARELLFQLHGDALARDARADTAALATVIEGMHGGDHPDIAQPLAHNPVVRGDERLLRDLIRQVYRDSVTCHAALAIYASRWPVERELPAIDPHGARFSQSIGCDGPPDLTRLALPTIRVAHLCGTTFRLRNELAGAADVSWDVPETGERGHLVLSPHGHRPYGEGLLTTLNRGTLRLYHGGRMFAIIGNSGGRPCAEGDTIPPIVPTARLFFPDDTGRSVAPAADSRARYYRTLIQVTFYDTTGGDQVRRAMEHWHSTIVAGGPYPTPYILRLPDPGSTWSAFDSLLGALRDEPGVQDAVPVVVRERVPR